VTASPHRSAKVLTVSDGVATGHRVDRSGAALQERLVEAGFEVVEARTVPDGVESVARALRDMAYGFVGVIVTTGGTGFGPRDLTPEGTRQVIEREAPGLMAAMFAVAPDKARLSRAVAGTIGTSIVINTPGSPAGAVECFDAVADALPHAVALLAGEPTEHP
jgi:molybdenum cofactor synthesis domain-containing protein